jgi:hypothetical protein
VANSGEVSYSSGCLNEIKYSNLQGSVGLGAAYLWLEVGVAVEQW